MITKYVWGKPVSFAIAVFGKDPETGANHNWSLEPLHAPLGEGRHPDLMSARHVGGVCLPFGVDTFYAPTPTQFNGVVIAADKLETRIELMDDVYLQRGADADGVILPKGAGFAMSTGGCPIIIATDGVKFVVAYAGLQSLTRPDEPLFGGVVWSIASQFSWLRRPYGWIFYSILPDRFVYSRFNATYGEQNQKLIRWLDTIGYGECVRDGGGIDLPTLIRKQFQRMGILCEPRDESCYLPEKAYDTACQPPFNRHRNLVVVVLNDIGE